jgi:hypothetical protein
MLKIGTLLFSWFLLGFPVFCLFAQEKNPSMLWRIKHPDQPNPSYLYFIASDNRESLFHFPDSVMAALHQSEHFYQLFSPSELTRMVLQSINEEGTMQSVPLKEAVSEQLWPLYAPSLQQIFGKPADLISLWETLEYFSKLKKTSDPESPFFTTSDLYLFEFARRLNKPVDGIWKLQNAEGKLYMPILENDLQWITSDISNTEEEKQSSDFVEAYLQGDIQLMQSICSCKQEGDLFLEKEMANTAKALENLAGKKPSFFLIPVGYLLSSKTLLDYLPGNITVKAVDNISRVDPKNIPLPAAAPQFTHVSDQLYGQYSAQIPGEYFKKLMGETMEMHIGADFFEESSFFIFSFPVSVDSSEKKNLTEFAAREFLGTKTLPPGTEIMRDGIEGWEYLVFENEIKVNRVQIFITGDHMVISMCTRENKNIPSSYEERFFNEIRIHRN